MVDLLDETAPLLRKVFPEKESIPGLLPLPGEEGYATRVQTGWTQEELDTISDLIGEACHLLWYRSRTDYDSWRDMEVLANLALDWDDLWGF